MRFTDKMIHALKPRGKRYEVLEGDGFTVMVYPSGSKTFYYLWKVAGKNCRLKLGVYPRTSLADAREKHRAAISIRHNGGDPRGNTKEAATPLTVKDICADFIKLYATPRRRRWEDDERLLNKEVVEVLGDRPAAEVTRREVVDLLNAIVKRGSPATANQVLKVWRRAWNFAIEQAVIETSPLHMVKAPAANKSKSRVLSPEEIKLFWACMDDFDGHKTTPKLRRVLKLILVTGQRPGECNAITQEQIDGDWWTIPPDIHKTHKSHRVFLSPLAKELIGKDAAPFGFDRYALSRALRRLLPNDKTKRDSVLPIPPFTPHDLRRTCATQLGALGYDNEQIGRFLGHTVGGVTAIYNRHAYDDLLKRMAMAWGTL